MISNALANLASGKDWILRGETYEDLEWLDQSEKPTKEMVLAEAARLQADYDAKQYQRNRAKEYPSIVDQLDTLYHGGYDAWKASIDVVKNKYPKGAA
ncbi:hypothetical protein UFOVP765_8 [uncultured Caudovirales phage]|uniref:Uncharacterized protein n=1 Tax=uncultured Caudovirales phage TaxID=2100421 RepID=A0A6J5NNR2_9CAUD|nr:hypothetical protein UFOVP765_8 [uncultured Caudovirales phage]